MFTPNRQPSDLQPTGRCVPRFAAAWPALALCALLAACGGGGGSSSSQDTSGGGGTTPTPITTPVTDPGSQTGGSGNTGSTPADPNAALNAALATGDASALDRATVQAATLAQLDAQSASYAAARRATFGLNADGGANASAVNGADWDPSHDSSWFTVLDPGRNHVMLASNWRYADGTAGTAQALAVLGQDPATQARYAAFGGNPLATTHNAAMDQLMKNTVAWLTGRSSFSGLKVVTAHLPGKTTYWFPHESAVRSWFATQYPGVSINGQVVDATAAAAMADDSCDGNQLTTCLAGADLLVIGRQQGPSGANSSSPDNYPASYDGATILAAVKAAQARGVPVLFLHHYRTANDLDSRLLAHFGLALNNNYWAQEGLKAYGSANLPAAPAGLAELRALLTRLDQGSFSSSFSGCVNNLGRVECEPSGSFAGDTTLASEFLNAAKALRTRLRSLDAAGTALFAQAGYTQEKLLVLLGDQYRASVSYPLTKETSGVDFYRAYFSDMTAYINRPSNQVARNLGNFSGLFAADTASVSRTVSATAPASGKKEVMTGLYVMPGRSVTLTRTDASAVAVTVGLNMLRDTTHVYNTYDRPTLLASPRVALAAGGQLTLTSPFGGPLLLFVEADASAPTVSVQVNGAITHPLLRNATDPAQVAAFAAEVASTPTNWVVLTTPALTVHSNLANFRQTLSTYGNDMGRLVAHINDYMIRDTYQLAGYQSAAAGSTGLAAEVTAFCAAAGWDCTGTQHARDVMQHVISDNYASCGSGCSGNPYDQNWALDPLGWGESHEIGHNIQPARLRIYAGQSGEVSNNIFPIHKQIVANRAQALGATPITARAGSTRSAFDLLKSAQSAADPAATVRAAMWADTAYAANNSLRLNFYRQLVEHARHYNGAQLGDGWALFTLLYLQERNFGAAGASWATQAAALGFGTYASYPSAIDGNDFMLVMASRIIGRDLRPVWDLWGVSYSAAASAQVAAYGLQPAQKLLFPMADLDADGAGVGAPVLMSITATYPAGF